MVQESTVYLRIRLNAAGHGTVELDGRDISRLTRSITFHSTAGELSSAVIELAAACVEIDADAAAWLQEQLPVTDGVTDVTTVDSAARRLRMVRGAECNP